MVGENARGNVEGEKYKDAKQFIERQGCFAVLSSQLNNFVFYNDKM